MRHLTVNVALHLASQTLFGQENPKFHAEKVPTSISEAHRVHNLWDKLAMVLQEVRILKRRLGGRVIKIGKYSFDSLE